MLIALSIRDVILIDRLDLFFDGGMCVFTGETGAGKSILLDSLGLTLGDRAGVSFIRPGQSQATVTATYHVAPGHRVFDVLKDHGISDDDDMIIIRRVIGRDGKSRSFLNDQAVGLSLLREIGGLLLDIHGQFDRLLSPVFHRTFLDDFGGFQVDVDTVKTHYAHWQSCVLERKNAQDATLKAAQDYDYLTAVLAELNAVSPKSGEEESLLIRRDYFVKKERRTDNIQGAIRSLTGERGVLTLLGSAYKYASKYDAVSPSDVPIAPLIDTIQTHVTELIDVLERRQDGLTGDGDSVDAIDDRLHLLRGLARKYRCSVDDLENLHLKTSDQLNLITAGTSQVDRLIALENTAKDTYKNAAQILSNKRKTSASALSQAVLAELPALKLDRVQFRVDIHPLSDDDWGPAGMDQVCFMIQTNPGMDFGPLAKIASGGEQSRLMLAIKVALAQESNVSMVIFDEIDSGVGGAVASAIGQCLARLSARRQVLSITHSPQVAACADVHYVVQKTHTNDRAQTSVICLDDDDRREELARMLSGSEITDEARAAASRLLG